MRDDTGIDYPDQRFYLSSVGRLLTTDPSRSSSNMMVPASWNKQSYVNNDPITSVDPFGLETYSIESLLDGGLYCLTRTDDEGGIPKMIGCVAAKVYEKSVESLQSKSDFQTLYPDCNPAATKPTEARLDFISTNYLAAKQMSSASGVPAEYILACGQ